MLKWEKEENLLARAVYRGSACYNLRLLCKDLAEKMAKDKILKKHARANIILYLHIIRMMASGHQSDEIAYSLKADLSEKEAKFHISRIESEYGDFVQIMDAIFHAKYRDFLKMGASEEQARDCCNEWIISEFFF
jgi:hypothetical protein